MIFFLYLIFVSLAIFFNNYMGFYLGISSLVITTCGPFFLWCLYFLIGKRGKIKKTNTMKIVLYIMLFSVFIMIFKIFLGQSDFVRECVIFLVIPCIFILTLENLSGRYISFLRFAMLSLYVFECILSVLERMQMKIFFANDDVYSIINKASDNWSFRSSALFGHPIANSMVVTVMIVFILCSNMKNNFKILLFMLGFLALLCFNSRAGIVISLIVSIPLIFRVIRNSSIQIRVLSFVLLIVGIISIYHFVIDYNFGGRLFMLSEKGFFNDASSQARLDVFDFIDYINVDELLYGNNDLYERLLILMNVAGLENGYIALILKYGLILGIPLLIFLILLHYIQLKECYSQSELLLILLTFYGFGMTNPHLANGTVWFMFLFSYYAFRSQKKIISNE